jgi:hypothetical protein
MKKKAELIEEVEHWKKQADKYLDKIQALEFALEGEIDKSGDVREKLDKMEKSQRRMLDFHAEYKYRARDIGGLCDILSVQEFSHMLSYFFCRFNFYLDTEEGPHGVELEINEEYDQPISDHGYISLFLQPDPDSSLLVRLEEKANEVE